MNKLKKVLSILIIGALLLSLMGGLAFAAVDDSQPNPPAAETEPGQNEGSGDTGNENEDPAPETSDGAGGDTGTPTQNTETVTPPPIADPTPESSQPGSPETSPGTSPSGSPETSPETSPSESPETSPETSPSGSPETSPETSPSESPETSPSGSPEVSPNVSPSGSVEPSVTPESSESTEPGGATPTPTPTPEPGKTPLTNPSITLSSGSATKVYDGTKDMGDASYTLSAGGLPGGYHIEAEFELDSADAGDRTVRVKSGSIHVKNGNNADVTGQYDTSALYAATSTYTIEKKSVTITASGVKRTDGTPSLKYVTVQNARASGLIPADRTKQVVVTAPDDLVENPDAIEPSPDTYPITIQSFTLVGGNADNYAVSESSTLKLRIISNPDLNKNPTVYIKGAAESVTYNGQPYALPDFAIDHIIPTNAEIAIGNITYSGEGAGETYTDADTYEVPLDAGDFVYTGELYEKVEFSIMPDADTLKLEITRRPLNLTVTPKEGAGLKREYDGTTDVPAGLFDIVPGSGEDAGLVNGHELSRDELTFALNGKDVGEHGITVSGGITVTDGVGADVTKNYEVGKLATTEKFEVVQKVITLKLSGEKDFGAADPAALSLTVTDKDGNNIPTNPTTGAFKPLINIGNDNETITFTGLDRKLWETDEDDAELPGAYEIEDQKQYLTYSGGAEGTNYHIEFAEAAFTVNPTPAFSLTLSPGSIDSHYTGNLSYTLNADGTTLLTNLNDYVNAFVEVAFSPDVQHNPKPGDAYTATGEGTYKLPLTLTEGTSDPASVAVDSVSYSDGANSWHAGLPAGTRLTLHVQSSDGAVDAISNVIDVGQYNLSMDITATYGAGTPGIVTSDEITLLDDSGTVTINYNQTDESGSQTLLNINFGGREYVVEPSDDTNGLLNKPLGMSRLLSLASGGASATASWAGPNPGNPLRIVVKLVDIYNNHATIPVAALNVAFDTGAGSAAGQTITNRCEEDELTIPLGDRVEESSVKISGNLGATTPTHTLAGDTLTLNGLTQWKSSPAELPQSGSTIAVSYSDLVGHNSSFNVNVERAQAAVSNTIVVKPMNDDRVPNVDLQFSGTTTGWEQSTLNIGGHSYDIKVDGGASYDINNAVNWSLVVPANEVFEVGVPTNVTLSYADLNGGDATITLTYDDKVQAPVFPFGAPIEGSTALWGYVEASSNMVIDIQHADGSTTPVMPAGIGQELSGAVEINYTGYFYVNLGSELRAGDVVIMDVTDFCGNEEAFEFPVAPAQDSYDTSAELLGADIVSGDTHLYATPVDLGELAKAEMKLPLLAYKGIEVGTVTLKLNGELLDMDYEFKDPGKFIQSGAQLRLASYDAAPGASALQGTAGAVKVEDLSAAPTGTVTVGDVSGYFTAPAVEGGAPGVSGVIWLSARVNVSISREDMIMRGGRYSDGSVVNFYRWLPADKQTTALLNSVNYADTASYADNEAYYSLYRRFESRA